MPPLPTSTNRQHAINRGELIPLSDLGARRFGEWMRLRYIRPLVRGRTGRPTPVKDTRQKYSISASLGVLAAADMHKQKSFGPPRKFAGAVFSAFARMPVAWFREQFAAGNIYFHHVDFDGRLVLGPTIKNTKLFDVASAYDLLLGLIDARNSTKHSSLSTRN